MLNGIERIKVLASEITDAPLLKIVNYLISREDMNDKYLNEEKSLKQMIKFIKKKVEPKAVNGVAIIDDEEVYGIAIHYFDETNENLKLVEEKETPEQTKEVIDKKVEVKKEVKPKAVSEGQLTLFDF